ncbi:DUF551 domain-containing protein [Salmonella enterica]|uniref:DUF551 domain-containing protein n=1 Tax=Salmonella enterica TaxID=28901 RepID=UPI003F43CC4B
MAELTKEWLKQTIAEYEANRDELPFGLDTNSAIELQAFKLALASLEAEPVAYIFKHPAGKLFWALTDESNKDQSDVIPVYAAPPVPVVPEEKPMPNPLKMYAVDAVAAIAEVRGWNACRAAMLQAEPVSQTYKSQHTQFEQVADLYEMQFDDGRTCAFHTDAQKAAQWLQACDGNRVQEYVKLERLQNALSGNSPVIPDGWISCSERMPDKLIPVMVMYEDGEMWSAMWNGNRWDDGTEYPDPHSVTHWREMPAAPKQEVNRG